ncbi:MAG TPA: kinase/pyrophosphorylase, partial [Burkholderiales bacterium]|nr:kinase/pyrophosphorylase [Burkholderiales bacterium]
MQARRTAFFVSDRTGITAEMLGHSLLTQFESQGFREVTVPFVDTPEKARELVERINQRAALDGVRPLVIGTLVDPDLGSILAQAEACYLDCFQTFIQPLEAELGVKSSHTVGRSHSAHDVINYHERIESINYA